MPKSQLLSSQDALELVLKEIKTLGADAGEAGLSISEERTVSITSSKIEKYEQAIEKGLSLTAYIGKQKGEVNTNRLDAESLRKAARTAVSLARILPVDPFAGIADPSEIARNIQPLDIVDPTERDMKQLEMAARAGDAAGLGVKGVTKSQGSSASWGRTTFWLRASNGFSGQYESTTHSLSVGVIAGKDQSMEIDHDYAVSTHAADMRGADDIGRTAGERAVAMLGARKMASISAPVIFDPRVSASLVSAFLGGISGNAVASGTTFLADKMGRQVFRPEIQIIEDPHLARRIGSSRFDSEGLPTQQRKLVEDGKMTTWLLNLESARRLKLKSTGHAGGTTNVWLVPGNDTPEHLMADIKQGFYVTGMMGNDISLVNGNYSRGAKGFWIENGKLTVPVSGMTVAGNLADMFADLIPANDLVFRGKTNAPTIRLNRMTIAGL